MYWRRALLLLSFMLALAPSSLHAEWRLFGRKSVKPNPAERVPELLHAVKQDGDEHKRLAAASELAQYDAQQFPDILPVLIQVLSNDSKASVRAEAAQTLGKLRPVNQPAGMALEQALAKDPAMRVRLQARSSLLFYRMHGYHGGKPDPPPPVGESKEPPLADPLPPPVKTAPTLSAPTLSQPRVVPKPLETAPPPLAPAEPPVLKPAPASGPDLVGPELGPPG